MQNTEMKRRTALLGGSFDPVHKGHLNLIHEAYSLAQVKHVILIPALISNFKQDVAPLEYSVRLELLKLAIDDYRDAFADDDIEIEISTIERERGGISYTSDTIRHFLPLFADGGKINFIIGDDLLENLDKWHEYEYIRENVRFLCFVRDGKARKYPESADVHFFKSRKDSSSSTAVRRGRVEMLSERVRVYIESHGLYRA